MTFLLRHRKYQRTFFFVLVAILVSLLFSYFDSYYDGLTNSTSTQNLYYKSDHFFDAEDQAAVEVYANGRLKLQNDGRRDSNYAPETDLNSRLRSLKEYVKELKSQKFIDTKKIADLEDIIRRREMSLSDSAYKDQESVFTPNANEEDFSPDSPDLKPFNQYYKGCYIDKASSRDLPHLIPTFTIHPPKCMTLCYARGYKYAGLQNGMECWCGMSFGRYQKVNENECTKNCVGIETGNWTCGGKERNSVWEAVNIIYDASKAAMRVPNDEFLRRPESSIWCTGTSRFDRICKARNIYIPTNFNYIATKTRAFPILFVRGPSTEIEGLRPLERLHHNETLSSFLDLSSLSGMLVADLTVLDIDKINPDFLKSLGVISDPSIMFARFLPSNIMHQLHDDMISLFWTLIDYTTPHHNHPSSDSLEGSSDLVFRSDRSTYSDAFRFILMDCHNTGQHLPFYRLLTSKSIIHISDIITDSDLLSKPLSHVALESTIIGLSKSMLWYQYGFETPQGPIPNKAVNGSRIRQFTQYIIRRIGGLSRNSTNIKKLMKRSKPLTEYEYWKRMKQDTMDYNGSTVFNSKTLVSPYSSFHVDPLIQSKFLYRPMERKIDQLDNNSDEEWRKQKFIVIFSRSKNRKIINEAEIITELEKAFDNYLVIIVRLEEMELNDIIQILQQTDVAIGIHGSILILSMFMKPGSLLVELFPYGIFSHHYTPYKTMAQLEGMNISYVAWENRHNNNTVTFPANHKMVGGINHLSSAERQDVLKTVPIKQHRCCEDPAWLFRIYQDTRVHVPEIIKILREHFQQMSRQEN